MATSQNRTKIVRDYLLQNPDIYNRTLARMLLRDYPELFGNVESARSTVRAVRGNAGDGKKHNSKLSQFYKENGNPEKIGKEFKLQPYTIGMDSFTLPHKKALVLSDIHLPYHDIEAVSIAVNKGVEMGCDCIYLNGDIIDCYSISRFLKEGGMPSFNEEREMLWEFFEYLQDSLDVPIYYKFGNHEERWEIFLRQNAKEIQDLDELKLENILRFEEFGITPIYGRQITHFGNLIIIHGHEFGEAVFSPVNPARGMFLKAKSSVLFGHNHQTSEHHENSITGRSMACFSTGALCQLNPTYRPFAFTKWNHGFAIVEIDDEGMFEIDNYRIIEGKAR